LENWVPDDATQSLIKHWIEVGREREGLRDHLDSELANHQQVVFNELKGLQSDLRTMQETLNRYTEIFTQVAHLLTVSSSLAQYELETIKFKKKRSNLSQDEQNKFNLSEMKDQLFRKLLSDLLPEIKHDFLLSDIKQSGENDA
jgi:hypothetical protein